MCIRDRAYNGQKTANARIASLRNQLTHADQWQKSNIRYSIGEWQKKRNSYSAIMKSEVAKWNKPIYENIADLNEQISNKEEEVKQKIKELDNTQSQVIADQSRRAALIQQRDSLVNAHDETMKQGLSLIHIWYCIVFPYIVSGKKFACQHLTAYFFPETI